MLTSVITKLFPKPFSDSWDWEQFDKYDRGVCKNHEIAMRLRGLGLPFSEAVYAFDNAYRKYRRETYNTKYKLDSKYEHENAFDLGHGMEFLEALLAKGIPTQDALAWSRVALMAALPISFTVTTALKAEVDPRVLLGRMEYNAMVDGGALSFDSLYAAAVNDIDVSMMKDMLGDNRDAAVYGVLVRDTFGKITVDIWEGNWEGRRGEYYAAAKKVKSVREGHWLTQNDTDGMSFFSQMKLDKPFDPRAVKIREFCINIIMRKTGKDRSEIRLSVEYHYDENYD